MRITLFDSRKSLDKVLFPFGLILSEILLGLVYSNTSLLALLSTMLMLCLVGLTVMRGDAGRLVLNPLRRMLKIVVRCKYYGNPVSSSNRPLIS